MHFKNSIKYLIPFLLISALLTGCGDGAYQDEGYTATTPPSTSPIPVPKFSFTSSDAVSANECEVLPGHTLSTENTTGAVTYAITGGADAARFTVDAATGAVSAADTDKTDFETKPTYTYDVSATSGGKTVTQMITVSIKYIHADINGDAYGCVPNNATGEVWLDRNLGADIVCPDSTEPTCGGELYQWGRETDGHQKRDSNTQFTRAGAITGVGSNVIVKVNTNWTTVDAKGALREENWARPGFVCPAPYRVPTIFELEAEAATWTSPNTAGAFASPLKLGATGRRNKNTTATYESPEKGYYRATTRDGIPSTSAYQHNVLFIDDVNNPNPSTGRSDDPNTYSMAIRCIKN